MYVKNQVEKTAYKYFSKMMNTASDIRPLVFQNFAKKGLSF